MQLKRALTGGLIATLAVVGLAVGTASPASAVGCPSGQPCFWPDSNEGGNWVFSGFTSYVGNAYNDQASSFQDRSAVNAVWYWNSNCGGNVAMILSPGQSQNASYFNNDETSSVCRS